MERDAGESRCKARIRRYMSAKKNPAAVALGRLGGKATGKRKARGDAQYYRDLQAKSAEKRRKKRQEEP